MNNIIEIKNISKRFPGVLAVDDVSISIKEGSVHAIVGGNGAGKSTLMKVLAGLYPYGSYEGEFYCDGELAQFKSILEAEDKGITMIPQEISMVDELSIAENLFLNKHPLKRGLVDRYTMFSEAQKILDLFNLDLNPAMAVKEIGVAQKQQLVIARAMFNESKVLILDEPTATLSDEESRTLFEKINELKNDGVACIYISHRLEEVLEISDVVTVVRDGQLVGHEKTENLTEKKIVSMMVGQDLDEFYPERVDCKGEKILTVDEISVYDTKIEDKKIVDSVSFDIYEGEIFSLYGLVGSGRTEMAMGMIGGWPGKVSSTLISSETEFSCMSPADALSRGIAILPEERQKHGVIHRKTVGDNITTSSLFKYLKHGLINKDKEHDEIIKMMDSLSIKANSKNTIINTLSGGNQQKVILSRLVASNANVLILDEATQGVDVGAKSQIYNIMNDLKKLKKGILYISSDLSEVMGVSDRIGVMRDGKLIKVFDSVEEFDREQILWYATVGKGYNDEIKGE